MNVRSAEARAVQVSEQAAGPRSLAALFEWRARTTPAARAATHKVNGRWEDVTWAEIARRARDVADGLAALGIAPGDRVAVIGETRLEWLLADLGIMGACGITVTIYQSNTPSECAHVLADSGARLVFCDAAVQVEKLRAARASAPALEGIIRAQGAAADAFERTLAEVEQLGAAWRAAHPDAHDERLARVGPDDVASLIYTSGTTGTPKGVMLTHGNWLYEARALETLALVGPDDLVLMFLPMAHSFAKALEAAWFTTGATAAPVEALDKLQQDAAAVRPTMMPGVPRVFEKIYEQVLSTGFATPGLRGKIFAYAMRSFDAYAVARAQGRTDASFGMTLARRLVFPKLARIVRQRFGGRIRTFISGGAPLAPKLAYFFELLGIEILEGYGLTETSAATFVNRPGQTRLGTVGLPMPGTEVRIAEDGEILLKGGGVMKGYFNRPAETDEALKGGWFATGDIGHVDEAGHLTITDRKKDIIVTAGGKKVAPQNLENDLKLDPLISQVMVHGDHRKFLTALITLDRENASAWAARHGVPPGQALEADPRVRARIQQVVDQLNARVAGYSGIKRFAIVPHDFTQDSGELTPTLKVKRKAVAERYKDLLDELYVEERRGVGADRGEGAGAEAYRRSPGLNGGGV